MSYEEFAKISANLNGGACSEAIWPEVEQTYMSCEIGKYALAYVYWNRTGYYEQLANAVKHYREDLENLKKHSHSCSELTLVFTERVFDSCKSVTNLVAICNKIFNEYSKKGGVR